MRDTNKVEIKGRLGQDPKVFINQAGKMVLIQVATHQSFMDQDGKWQQKTTWHQVKAYGRTVDLVKKVKKGQEVLIKGRLENATIEHSGKRFTSTNVIATSIEIVPSRSVQKEQRK